ncbi:hypothetical protein [Planobispora longispora]|uniref:Uncharacterized protein n=1 Tax=Planobispora longispora TaxID=28887 RepID=A0A8J3RUA7_9ACTN|nr:hypothetical protein [Planobispora longispora]BFE83811.1 hypothetical protein GCM10020093_064120 [Planobispora longispora]GIH78343.1 hypothetical protein Plo01_47720 [Planobispora longispora]
MGTLKENQHAYQVDLLTALRGELSDRETTAVLVTDQKGRPCLDVTDRTFRTRRVYVHIAFQWFYWGDRPDERVSCLRLLPAADRVAEAARAGWHEGEQGELGLDLTKIIDAYRT